MKNQYSRSGKHGSKNPKSGKIKNDQGINNMRKNSRNLIRISRSQYSVWQRTKRRRRGGCRRGKRDRFGRLNDETKCRHLLGIANESRMTDCGCEGFQNRSGSVWKLIRRIGRAKRLENPAFPKGNFNSFGMGHVFPRTALGRQHTAIFRIERTPSLVRHA